MLIGNQHSSFHLFHRHNGAQRRWGGGATKYLTPITMWFTVYGIWLIEAKRRKRTTRQMWVEWFGNSKRCAMNAMHTHNAMISGVFAFANFVLSVSTKGCSIFGIIIGQNTQTTKHCRAPRPETLQHTERISYKMMCSSSWLLSSDPKETASSSRLSFIYVIHYAIPRKD